MNDSSTSLQSTSFNGPEIISTNLNNSHPNLDDIDSSNVILSQPVSLTTYDSQQNAEEDLGSSTINTENEEVKEIRGEIISSRCREVLYNCFCCNRCSRSPGRAVASRTRAKNNVYDDHDDDDDDDDDDNNSTFCCTYFYCCQLSSPECCCDITNCSTCDNCELGNCECKDCDCDCGNCGDCEFGDCGDFEFGDFELGGSDDD